MIRRPRPACRIIAPRRPPCAPAYAGALAAPVPERLRAIVEDAERTRARPVLRRAAAGLVVVAAGLGGWLVGHGEDDTARRALLDESYRQFVLRGPEMALSGEGGRRARACDQLDRR